MGSRPGWKYALWIGGWNFLALAWIGVGAAVGIAAFYLCSPWLRKAPQLNGAVSTAVGVAVVAADLIWRHRDPDSEGWTRYVSPLSGGAVVFIPAWLIGFGIIATGVATLFGAA